MKKLDKETTDIVELIKNGPVGHNFVPEQERNFDAGHTPSKTLYKYRGSECIGGKWYDKYS